MVTIDDFNKMTDIEQVDFLNEHFKHCNTKTFKNGNVDFSWYLAEKVLKKGIKKVNDVYMTKNQIMKLLNDDIEDVEPLEDNISLSGEEIINLKKILRKDNFNILLKLMDASMTNIQLIKGSGEVKLTSIRVYNDTWEKWKEFCKGNDEYSALDILNTALLDFMNRYE